LGTNFYTEDNSGVVAQIGFHRCFESEPDACEAVSWLETPATYSVKDSSSDGSTVAYFNYSDDGGSFNNFRNATGSLTVTGSERIDSAVVIEGTFNADDAQAGSGAYRTITDGSFRLWLGNCM
jgi:hypothetical protein